MSWLDAAGPWLVTLNSTEDRYAIPQNLLARIAYQESHFRPDIISGAVVSPAGAVGIMQLLPQYFPGAGQSPQADIDTAGKFLSELDDRFHDWTVAVAAYNWGGGNVHHEYAMDANKYVLADMPTETQNYVRDVFADVPVTGVLV